MGNYAENFHFQLQFDIVDNHSNISHAFMSHSRPNWLHANFSHPIALFRLENIGAINSELRKIILASESEDSKNTNPSQKIQPEVFESKFDFLNWQNPIIESLRKGCINRLQDVITNVTGIEKNTLTTLSFGSTSWFHITRRGGYVQPHDHPNASWSLVYCVSSGQKDENHLDSGSLIIQNPSGAVNMYKDPCNSEFLGDFSQNQRRFNLAPGDMVIFPSYLSHWVSPYMGNAERITIASNWWFFKS